MTVSDLPVRRKARPTNGAVFRFTVNQYHRMIEDGILREGEPVELLNGQLVRKDRSAAGANPMTVSTGHATTVDKLNDLNPRFKRLGAYIRIQQPVTLPPYNEPEPDAAIVIGKITDFSQGHPRAKDIVCAIEVADSSLEIDRGRKRRIYANTGIPMFVILNLVAKVVEVYTKPQTGKGRYSDLQIISPKQSVNFAAPGGKIVKIQASLLLP